MGRPASFLGRQRRRELPSINRVANRRPARAVVALVDPHVPIADAVIIDRNRSRLGVNILPGRGLQRGSRIGGKRQYSRQSPARQRQERGRRHFAVDILPGGRAERDLRIAIENEVASQRSASDRQIRTPSVGCSSDFRPLGGVKAPAVIDALAAHSAPGCG